MTSDPSETNVLEAAEKHYLAGRLDQAEAIARRVLKRPDAPAQTILLLSKILIESGKPEQAAFELERVLRLRPDDSEIMMMLHNAYLGSQRTAEALEIAEKSANANPGSADTACAVASIHLNEGRIVEAERWYERARAADPESVKAVMGLSRVLATSLRGRESAALLRAALDANLRRSGTFRVLAFQLQYVSGVDPAEAFEIQKTAGRVTAREADGFPPRLNVSADPEKKLTIGYLSADFRQHACAHFIEPLLAARDRGAFRVIAYSNTLAKDATTKRLRGQFDLWREVSMLKDAPLARQIAEDAVDFAIDLAGHTGGSRLPAFVLRPAPMTVNYIGYPGTTGTPGVDFRLVDSTTDPAGAEALATEKLIRLDPCFLCFRPLPEAPAVSEAPCSAGAGVTFGSFNVLDKVSEGTLDAWAGVLKGFPGSRLLLKTKPLADESVRERVRRAFEARGIDPGRLELIGWAGSLREHLELYRRVDIALDTMPYNGTTTTCEAMWMGVPVVTLRGGVHASRVGASLVGAVGLRELIAASVDEYIAIATALGEDRNRIMALRAGMRARMAASPLRDERGFMARYEGALRALWREWCASKNA